MKEGKRDIGTELLEAISDIKQGHGKRTKVEIPDNISEVRHSLDLTQSRFAALMGVSLRTLQEWEQGRRKPSGAALTLLRIAQKHPEAFVDL